MKRKPLISILTLGAPLLLVAAAMIDRPSQVFAAEAKQSASAENSVAEPRAASAKTSTAGRPAGAQADGSSLEKPLGGEQKTQDAVLRALDQANDYWTTCFGGFHMFGASGHAVYRYPAQPTGTPYDTNWSFVDDFPVGGRAGWTYKEDGFQFYMFFAKSPDSNGKFWTGYSHDNATFPFYAWAD